MRTARAIRVVVAMCACVLAACMVAGCASGVSEQDKNVQANRQYMSQVNQSMDELNGRLDSFIDAVSRGDVVNMKSQAANAYKALDKLNSMEAPEALADVQKHYVEGSSKLREALDAYIALYTQANAESEGADFDWSDYDSQVAAIQKIYDEGIKALQEGDKIAADLT